MLGRISHFFYGACLVTVPWSGMGLLSLLTGRDWGFGLQPSWFFLFLAIVFQLAETWFDPRSDGFLSISESRWFSNPLNRILCQGGAAMLIVLGLSGIGIHLTPSGEPMASAWWRFGRQVIQLLIMLAFLVWPAMWTRGRERWRFTIQMLLLGATLQLGYGLLQQWDYYQPGPLLPALEKVFTSNPAILSGSGELYLGDVFRNVPRLRGTMCEPLYLGNYLMMVLPWLVWGRRWVPLGSWVFGGLVLLLVLTWSRGAWLGLGLQGGALLLWATVLRAKRSGNISSFLPGQKIQICLAAGFLIMLAGALFSDFSFFQLPRDRLIQSFSSRDWSNLTRLYSMQTAWRAFLLSPLVGVGWGQFSFHFPLLVDPLGLQSQFTWPVVNNFPLKILCETGILGFLVFLGWAGRLIVNSWRDLSSTDEARVAATMAALIALLGVWAQLLTFSQYNLPHIWLAIGLLLAVQFDEKMPDPRDAGK